MAKLFSLGVFVFFMSVQIHASQCSQWVGSCDYYQCLSESKSCKPNEYPLAFGYIYCEKFDSVIKKFSSQGQVILSRLKMCLQSKIESLKINSTCGEIRQAALKHHVECYEQNGYCELTSLDRYRIFKIVSRELYKPDFLLTALHIQKLCMP